MPVRLISEEEAKKYEGLDSRLRSLAEGSALTSVITAAVSGVINYFGGPEYSEPARYVFWLAGVSLVGALPYIVNVGRIERLDSEQGELILKLW